MEKSAGVKENYLNGNLNYSFSSSSASIRHVSYSCGTCGYELNLNSSNRNTATIGSKYGKSIKRGIISFFDIDESRFTQAEEFQCIPNFSKNSWDGSDSSSANDLKRRKYDVRIRALQPSADRYGTPLYL
ncbi:uncharacterized protein At4g08330, chloroplastic isoform X2 [Euphorbia lathyris]|uniref:uncharacterized protein At4g08330, chloroplastic isoform X2 n=1 Tax=Euphorbia lathyris TaxID=212925 RepID=UPI0033132100